MAVTSYIYRAYQDIVDELSILLDYAYLLEAVGIDVEISRAARSKSGK